MTSEREKQRWENFLRAFERVPTYHTYRIPIWKKNKATLWYYQAPKKKYGIPIYLIYSIVNQPFILDLYPGSSFIESLVNNGFDVYLIDFGIPGYEDKDLTLDDYIVDYIEKGAQRVLEHSGTEELTVMGFCLGGTIAAMYASISTVPICNLILDVAPIDFSNHVGFDEWGQALVEEDLQFDDIIDSLGLIPSTFMEAGVRLITSPIYYSPYLSLLNRAYDAEYVERWKLFNQWTEGHIPMSGGVLKQLIDDFAKHNRLVKGTLKVGDRKVDLAHIHANLLVIASEYDRLVPKETTYKIMDLVSSKDKKYHLLQSGHASLSKDGRLPEYIRDWLPQRSNPL